MFTSLPAAASTSTPPLVDVIAIASAAVPSSFKMVIFLGAQKRCH